MAPDDAPFLPALTLSIAAVERDTGLSKDTLRVWERRYGFPHPARDTVGERAYPVDQVDRLRIIKRLLDAGHRPGKIVPLPIDALQQLAATLVASPRLREAPAPLLADLDESMALVRRHDVQGLRRLMGQVLQRVGLATFVTGLVAPMNRRVGDAWLAGTLEVFEEHMYTESVQIVLRNAINQVPLPPTGGQPRLLLTTFPGEPHGIGLLMAEALLALEGCHCVSLGTQTPLWDIVLAANAHRVDIVALSFTAAMNPNHVLDGLTELRAKLPERVELWAGGTAPVLDRRRQEGVLRMDPLDAVTEHVRRWRAAAAETAG